MADLSTGDDDKSVTKANSFNALKFIGKSPGRSLSSKKSANPFSKMFSGFSRSKKIDKKTVEEYANDISPRSSTEVATNEVIEETAPATLLQKLQDDAPKVIQEVISHANTDNLAKELTNAIPVVESKESTPVAATEEEKKQEFFSKLNEGAEKAKGELKAKAKDELHKIEGGITEAYKSFTSTYKKEPIEQQQPIIDDKKNQEKDVKTVDEPNVPVPLSSPNPTQGEAVVVAGVAEPTETEETNRGENPDEMNNNKQEENCVAYLAEGLQKMCAPWNNNNKKED